VKPSERNTRYVDAVMTIPKVSAVRTCLCISLVCFACLACGWWAHQRRPGPTVSRQATMRASLVV